MEIVNFYKGKEKVYSVYANSLKKVLENPGEYFGGGYDAITTLDIDFPVYFDGEIREATKEEKIILGYPYELEDGEKVEDKKLVIVPIPTGLYRAVWDRKLEEWTEGANKIDLLKEKSEKVLKLRKIKIEINTLKEIAEIDEELADAEMIELYQNEYNSLKKEILDLSKIIKSL